MRAGKIIIGTEFVCDSMAKRGAKRPKLVLITSTASEGTRDKIIHKAEFYGVEVRETDITGDELGSLLGKLYAPAAIAISDEGFANEIKSSIDKIREARDV